jgi:hypothetical protein
MKLRESFCFQILIYQANMECVGEESPSEYCRQYQQGHRPTERTAGSPADLVLGPNSALRNEGDWGRSKRGPGLSAPWGILVLARLV